MFSGVHVCKAPAACIGPDIGMSCGGLVVQVDIQKACRCGGVLCRRVGKTKFVSLTNDLLINQD